MEQRAVIHFSALKGLKSRAIHTEIESVHSPEALPRPTVKNWGRFHQGRMELFGDPRSGRPLTYNLAGAIGSMLKERPFKSCMVLCRHFRIGKVTGLRSFMTSLA
jgi:hypothetical protein